MMHIIIVQPAMSSTAAVAGRAEEVEMKKVSSAYNNNIHVVTINISTSSSSSMQALPQQPAADAQQLHLPLHGIWSSRHKQLEEETSQHRPPSPPWHVQLTKPHRPWQWESGWRTALAASASVRNWGRRLYKGPTSAGKPWAPASWSLITWRSSRENFSSKRPAAVSKEYLNCFFLCPTTMHSRRDGASGVTLLDLGTRTATSVNGSSWLAASSSSLLLSSGAPRSRKM